MIIVANWKSNLPSNWEEFKSLSPNLLLAPPYTHIKFFDNCVAQDFSLQRGTSRISLDILINCDIKYCIVGHVEVREEREKVREKVDILLEKGVKPIMCTQYPLEEIDFIKSRDLILAFEPAENIGSGKIIDVAKLSKIVDEFKAKVDKPLLYGGSINSENYRRLKDSGIDGFLVGSASLSLKDLNTILKGCGK